MKVRALTHKLSLLGGLLIFMQVFGVGCASKSEEQAAPPSGGAPGGTPPPTPDGNIDLGSDFTSGAVADMTIDSIPALEYFVGTHPVNDPKKFKISVKLKNVGSTEDGKNITPGQVFFSYIDGGQPFTSKFYAEDRYNPTGDLATSGTYYPGWHHAAYNTWFIDPITQKRVFHGFFQDDLGALMIILDDVQDLGDGGGATSASGSIWFKNFANSPYDDCGTYRGDFSFNRFLPYTGSCQKIWMVPSWFRLNGPYDTRTFLVNANGGMGDIVTTSALYPQDSQYYSTNNPYIPKEKARGWRRLGTFNNLELTKAFSQ